MSEGLGDPVVGGTEAAVVMVAVDMMGVVVRVVRVEVNWSKDIAPDTVPPVVL